MSANTPRYAITYPLQTDPTNVPAGIETPLDQLDAIIATAYSGALASRPAAGIMGRRYYATDANVIYFDTGSSWIPEGPIASNASLVSALNPSNSPSAGGVGQAADVAHIHPMPAWGSASDYQPSDTTGSAGSTGRIADAGHVHPGDFAGKIEMYGGTSAPTGYVICNGALYYTSSIYGTPAYPELFAAIGYTWAGSNPSTHQLRCPISSTGLPWGQVTFTRLGNSGELSVILTTAMLPAHAHSITDPGHSHFQAPQTVVSAGSTIGLVPTSTDQALFSDEFQTLGALTGINGTNNSAAATQQIPIVSPVTGILFVIRAY